MGMVNYLAKFIQNLSTINKPLRELLEKDIAWHWVDRHDVVFRDLTTVITNPPVLAYYNFNKLVTLSGCII